jgi:hypothetical protein
MFWDLINIVIFIIKQISWNRLEPDHHEESQFFRQLIVTEQGERERERERHNSCPTR